MPPEELPDLTATGAAAIAGPARPAATLLGARPSLSSFARSRRCDDGRPRPGVRHVWFRLAGQCTDDPELHRCLLAYVSDFHLLETATLPHGLSYPYGRRAARQSRSRHVVSQAVPHRRLAAQLQRKVARRMQRREQRNSDRNRGAPITSATELFADRRAVPLWPYQATCAVRVVGQGGRDTWDQCFTARRVVQAPPMQATDPDPSLERVSAFPSSGEGSGSVAGIERVSAFPSSGEGPDRSRATGAARGVRSPC